MVSVVTEVVMQCHAVTKEKQPSRKSAQAFQRKWHLNWKNEWNFPSREEEREYSKQKQYVQIPGTRIPWHIQRRMRTSWNIQHKTHQLSITTFVIIFYNFTRPVDNCPIVWPLSTSLSITIQKGRVRENLLSLPDCLSGGTLGLLLPLDSDGNFRPQLSWSSGLQTQTGTAPSALWSPGLLTAGLWTSLPSQPCKPTLYIYVLLVLFL